MRLFAENSIYFLKHQLQRLHRLPFEHTVLSHEHRTLQDHSTLLELLGPRRGLNLVATVLQPCRRGFNIPINVDFQAIREVKKIRWSLEAPSYRDTQDGLSWCCYCL